MPRSPYDDSPPSEVGIEADARRERSLGEHIFIWVAWALAAAFWGATTSAIVGILRATADRAPTVSAPGAPGGMGYLALVVAAFLVVGFVMLYAELRTARSDRRDSMSEAGAAALYNQIDRPRGDAMNRRSPGGSRLDQDLR